MLLFHPFFIIYAKKHADTCNCSISCIVLTFSPHVYSYVDKLITDMQIPTSSSYYWLNKPNLVTSSSSKSRLNSKEFWLKNRICSKHSCSTSTAWLDSWQQNSALTLTVHKVGTSDNLVYESVRLNRASTTDVQHTCNPPLTPYPGSSCTSPPSVLKY